MADAVARGARGNRLCTGADESAPGKRRRNLVDVQRRSHGAQVRHGRPDHPANVAHLEKAWEVHTGDVSKPKSLERDIGDSLGHTHHQSEIPPSDWSATPLFVNDTVYVATPFYPRLASAP
jgi:glucose dehydrogenase